MRARDRAIQGLLEQGWTTSRVGQLFGITDRRVRQIRAAARRRVEAIRDVARCLESARGGCSDGA